MQFSNIHFRQYTRQSLSALNFEKVVLTFRREDYLDRDRLIRCFDGESLHKPPCCKAN